MSQLAASSVVRGVQLMTMLLNLQAAPASLAMPSTRRRPLARAIVHWTRRLHLYSGLLMFPWVLLYGLTALLFNHVELFSDREQWSFGRDDFAGTALEPIADPVADAAAVVAALNAENARGQHATYRLVDEGSALYTRDVLMARARGPGQNHSILYDVPSGTAQVGTAEQPATERPPFAGERLKVAGALTERVKTGLPRALARHGFSAPDVSVSVGPELVFLVEGAGRVWRATYNTQTGSVNGQPSDGPGELTTRQFLTRMHLAHGYPSRPGLRWLWAAVVDAMFVSMVFWALSGLVMWWQIKAVRITGAAVVAISLGAAGFLAAGMHGILAAG
jgi:hypothetical protein